MIKNNLSNPTFMAEGDVSSSQMVAVVLVGFLEILLLHASAYSILWRACFVILFLKSMN